MLAHLSREQETAALRDFNPAYVGSGSKSVIAVMFAARPLPPMNRHSPAPIERPLRAIIGPHPLSFDHLVMCRRQHHLARLRFAPLASPSLAPGASLRRLPA